MSANSAPDLASAARHLDSARTSILEALRVIHNPIGAEALRQVARQLELVAKEFMAYRLLGGLRVPLVDRKMAARAMGQLSNEKKVKAIAKARQILAQKRAMGKGRQRIR